MPLAMGPAGTKAVGRWAWESAPMIWPGAILSQMPSSRVASKVLWERETAVAWAMRSREKRDMSIPGWPWVTPSHMAGTPPATWALWPSSARAPLMMSG